MTKKIHILEPIVANQIAAGEVVERPASVIKELLENSIDAQAKRIQIDIEKGGLQLIRVRDDGDGISKRDLPLALSPHATSKIQDLKDLDTLYTLGFRGEALASISAVSRMSITSLTETAQNGWRVQVAGRQLTPSVEPAAHPIGTTVEVRDLFFNTPARRKFLRTEKTEFSHIEETIKRAALSRFDIGFLLRHNQRLIANIRPSMSDIDQDKRVAQICGAHFVKHARRIEFDNHGLRLWGWLGSPVCARSSSDLQFFYVNGRVIRDKLVSHALRLAFQALLPQGRHPCYVLFLEIAPEKVDINVHPTKHEVRFQEGRLVHDFILQSMRCVLQETEKLDTAVDGTLFLPSSTEPISTEKNVAAVGLEHFQRKISCKEKAVAHLDSQQLPYDAQRLHQPLSATQEALLAEKVGAVEKGLYHKSALTPKDICVQLYDSYVLLGANAQFKIVDIKLAKRRIYYGTLLRAWQGGDMKSQPLLIPCTLRYDEMTIIRLQRIDHVFDKLGVQLTYDSADTVTISQVPEILRHIELSGVFEQLTQQFCQADRDFIAEDIEEVLNIFVDALTQEAPRRLTNNELQQLIIDLEAIEAQLSLEKLQPAAINFSHHVIASFFEKAEEPIHYDRVKEN